MDQNLQRILLNAQKSGVLQLNMSLKEIPREIYQLNTLKLSDKGFYENQDLKRLLLKGCDIESIHDEINMLDTLEILEIPQNKLNNFVTLTMQFLTRLNLQGNKLYQGIDISQLPSLKQLYLNENQLQGTIQMQSQTLQILHINKNHINTLILDMPELIELVANNNDLQRIGLHTCQKLQQLELQYNQLKHFDFTQLINLQTLNLQRNGLIIDQKIQFQFPHLQSLEILNLSENQIVQLDISCFINQKIKELVVSNSGIEQVIINIDPTSEMFLECISAMKKSVLSYIDLQGNNLQLIAPELCFLNQLRKIALTGNPMRKMSKLLQIQDKIESVRQYLQDKLPMDHPGLRYEAKNVINTKTNINYYVNTNKLLLDGNDDFQEEIFSNLDAQRNFVTINIQNIDVPQSSLETTFLRHLSKFQNVQCITLHRLKYLDNLQIFNLKSLVQITCTQLPSLEYVVINNCLALQSIEIKECRLVDAFINNCTGVRNLNLSHNSLDKFPDCIFDMPNLVELQLGNNNIESIPDKIESMKSLQKISLENNNIKTLKASLGRCISLQQIKLDGNNIVRPSRQVINRPTHQLLQFLRGE